VKAVTFALVLVIWLSVINCVSAGPDRTEAEMALNMSIEHMRQMQEAGFHTTRINDTLADAVQMFKAQTVLEDSGGVPDYSLVTRITGDIESMKNKAFRIYDELQALEMMTGELEGEDTGLVSVIEEARTEFGDERYDESLVLIEKAYDKISEEQSLNARLSFILENAGKNIVTFLAANWLLIVLSLTVLVVFLAAFHNALSRMRIRRRIRKLEIKKDVLNDMIKQLQHEYFELGKTSEDAYRIKMKKFNEMLRDIEREKPLLNESLEKKTGRRKSRK